MAAKASESGAAGRTAPSVAPPSIVSALSGHAHVMALYRHAVESRYRFFSYGDAMLLQRR